MNFENQTIRTTPNPLGFQNFPCNFGSYELLKPIAQGGMGMVYQVRQEGKIQEFALKILTDWREKTAIQRFKNEISLISKLKHPGIVSIYDYGEDQGIPFLVMDLIEGESLSSLLKKEGTLPLKRCLKILMQVCMALDYAHMHGVIHRDIKPANILLTPQGNPRLVDFGLAKNIQLDEESQKLTQTGQILGTPAYMPPEVISGAKNKIGSATDIYSLGVTLYELLTGKLPYMGENSLHLFQQILSQSPIPPRYYNPAIPIQVEAVILKCLNREPQDRYSTVRDLGKDISRYLSDIPIEKHITSGIRHRFLSLKQYWFFFFVALVLAYGWKWHTYHSQILEQVQQKHDQELQKKTQQHQQLYEFLKLEQQATSLESLRSEKMKRDHQLQAEQFLMQQKLLAEESSQLEENIVFLKTQQHQMQEEQKKLAGTLQEITYWTFVLLQEMNPEGGESFLKKYRSLCPEFNTLLEILKAEKQEEWSRSMNLLLELPTPFQEMALSRASEIALLHFQDMEQARSLLKKLETLFPKSPFLAPAKAGILFTSRDYEALAKLLKEAPTEFSFASLFYFQGILDCKLVNYRSSNPWRATTNLKKGLKSLQKAVYLKPENPSYTQALALAFYFKTDFLSAAVMFQETIKLRGDATDWICFAATLLKIQDDANAKLALEKARTLETENELALYFQGLLKIKEGHPEAALPLWESASFFWQKRMLHQNFLFPGHLPLLESLQNVFQSTHSTLLLHLGEWKKAGWMFDAMLKKNTNSQKGAIGIAKSFWFQNQPSQAHEYFRQAWFFLEDKIPETFLWNTFYYLKQKDIKRATMILEGLSSCPDPIPVTLLFFQELLHLLPEDISTVLQHCSEKDRSWANALILYSRGKTTLDQLWQSHLTIEQQAQTYFYLGMIEKQKGQERKATEFFEQSLQKQQVLLEEYFMAWIELGGDKYPAKK